MRVKIRNHFYDILEIKTSAHSIGAGVAVGSFFAILPLPGFTIILVMLMIFLFKRISKIAVFCALSLFNPVICIPLYQLSYTLGHVLSPHTPIYEFQIAILNRIYYFSNKFLLGNVLVAALVAIISSLAVFLVASHFFHKNNLLETTSNQ